MVSMANNFRHLSMPSRLYATLPRGEGRASFVIDKVEAMMRQEQTVYLYRRYIKPPPNAKYLHEDPEDMAVWREKICHWTYSVIDHFELSRKTVAVSINLFDRYLATQGNRCDGSLALLISLTTLYIAIKVHEKKKIKLSTLTELSRSQFSGADIEEMEVKILQNLSWLVHPPTVVDFISHLLKFLPPAVSMPVRQNIFELSRYMAELSVCDPFFIEHHPSTIAFSAIINVLDGDMNRSRISAPCRSEFYKCLEHELGFCRHRPVVRLVCDRLQTMIAASGVVSSPAGYNKECFVRASTPPTAARMERSKSDDPSKNMISSALYEHGGRKVARGSGTSRSSSCDSRNSIGSRGSTGSRLFRIKGSLVTPC
jgi:hypothetical protein